MPGESKGRVVDKQVGERKEARKEGRKKQTYLEEKSTESPGPEENHGTSNQLTGVVCAEQVGVERDSRAGAKV